MTTSGIRPVLRGPAPDPNKLYANLNPVRYRYVMAYLHDEVDPATGVLHKAGEVMYVLPMTGVTYAIGMYSGTEMSGTVYLSDFYLDQMAHPPLNIFDRRPHPDRSGIPLGAVFECGNRAIYVMRNEKVVWGGILWGRSYSSGNATLGITALSWEGYIYYRLLRKSVVFLAKTNAYTIWWAVLAQALSDFTRAEGAIKDATRFPTGSAKVSQATPWTGLTRTTGTFKQSNADARSTAGAASTVYEAWPENSPNIELPPSNLLWKRGTTEVKTTVNETFRGYDMNRVGDVLEQWADTQTIAGTIGSTTSDADFGRFEYRVASWFDASQQIFRQRYLFGEMNDPTNPTAILRGSIGRNTAADLDTENNLTFDYPGHISAWTLNETMEDTATRVIVTDDGDAAAKHTAYASNDKLMLVPKTPPPARGSQGWTLYDRNVSFEGSDPTVMQKRANRLLELAHPPMAAQINDLAAANQQAGQRTSARATDLSVTLYTDPTTPFPEFGLGDWATFAIEDPFYGGKMYLQRRIIGYSVTVVSEQESDYSHEEITLELTDETRISETE